MADLGAAARCIPAGAHVFVTAGRGRIEAAPELGRHHVVVRRRAPTREPFPFPDGHYRVEEGPFTVTGERDLFRRLGIEWLILHNAGGEGAWPKVAAARELGLPVAMIRRPDPPESSRVETAEAALAWVRARL